VALHLPPKKPSDVQVFVAHLELALEARVEAMSDDATGRDAMRAVLDCVAEARREMGW
jgi:hypothetical protein